MSARQTHERFEELVAGYALSALEPEDEQVLLKHMPTCAACERDLAAHRETLAHLAYAGEVVTPPDSLWEGIRSQVTASGPSAFPEAQPAVDELAAARARRALRPGVRRAAGWTAVAAALALVASLGAWNVALRHDRDEQGAQSSRLAAAVRTFETGPGRTIPLTDSQNRVIAVALTQGDRMSLVVDGLPANDPTRSIYVLWAKSAAGEAAAAPAAALATFDVRSGDLNVLRDMALPASLRDPALLVITREPGRTAPATSAQAAAATGRAA